MGREGKGRGVKMLHTYVHTDRHTDRASDEAGPRGAFAPKKCQCCMFIYYVPLPYIISLIFPCPNYFIQLGVAILETNEINFFLG